MSSAVAFSWGEMVSLESLVASGEVKLGRGNVISKIDIQNNPGPYPIYSSSSKNDGKMGEYGDYMFDEEMISWSVDGGGYFFHRPKHKFSVTNVSGYMRLNSDWDYKFTAYSFQFQHGYFSFDYQTKAHPSVIREFYFLPKIPVAEQQKIATILSSVDDVIEKTRAQIDKLKDLKTGMMQELLTKGIGHTEFKDSPVGRIPASWDVLHLEELVKAEKNITYGIVQAGAHHDGGVPYIRVSDMTKRALSRNGMLLTSPEIAEKYHRSAVSCGDIVYALRGVIGHVLVVPKELDGANLTQGTARISPNDKVDSGYLLWAMKSPYVNEQNDLAAKGSTFREVTLASLRKIQVALPELSEQKKIASIFDSVELNIFSIEDQLAQLQSIKKALMQDLLTGKVRVKTQKDMLKNVE